MAVSSTGTHISLHERRRIGSEHDVDQRHFDRGNSFGDRPSGPNALRFDGGTQHWVHVPSPDDTTLVARPKRLILWILLVIASMLMGTIAFASTATAASLQHLIARPESWPHWAGLTFHVVCCSMMAVFAYLLSIVLTCGEEHQVRHYIGGSGIPELKCELTGAHLIGIFSLRVLLAKLLGLVLCVGSSLPVGAEGTFVHVSAGASHHIMLRLSFFRRLLQLRALRHMVLTAMVAVGVACTFGAPIGGVLYAVEMMDDQGSVAYLHAILGATIASIVRLCWGSLADFHIRVLATQPLFKTNVKSVNSPVELVTAMVMLYLCLGVICGMLGALFVKLHSLASKAVRLLSVGGGLHQMMDDSLDGPSSSDFLPSPTAASAAASATASRGAAAAAAAVASAAASSSRTLAVPISLPFGFDASRSDTQLDEGPHAVQTFSTRIQDYVPLQPSFGIEAAAARGLSGKRLAAMVFLVALCGAVNSTLMWVQPVLRDESQAALLSKLVSTGNDKEGHRGAEIETLELALAILSKFLLTIFVLALPLPVGAIVPTFVIGALVGRLYARLTEPVCSALREACDEQWDFEARAAMVGASAFCAGTMRSFAQVIVVFELTGLTDMLIPLCAASMCAIFVGNALAPGFIQSVIMAKRLPHLPSLARGREALSVADIMRTDIPTLPPYVSAADVNTVREQYPAWHFEVPIVTRPNWARAGHAVSPAMFTAIQSEAGGKAPADRLVLLSAIKEMPMAMLAGTGMSLMDNALVPLQVPAHTTLKALLPLLVLLEKSVAFVTRDGCLLGAVTLTDLYDRATGTS